ncbi:MAG: demethoxyubiquinone hydroxylase family protein [Pseudomonadota bacterium]
MAQASTDEGRTKRRSVAGHFPGKQGGQISKSRLHEIIRVDHAGEYGATRIYAGQLAVFRNRPGKERTTALIQHMADQEDVHKETFDRILNERSVRPTALHPFWNVAGFMLGAGTALMGEKAAMACTAAVESVIDEHYANQMQELGAEEEDLIETIERFRLEELEHHDTAIDEGAEQAPAYRLLSEAIKLGCRVAIKVSEKV